MHLMNSTAKLKKIARPGRNRDHRVPFIHVHLGLPCAGIVQKGCVTAFGKGVAPLHLSPAQMPGHATGCPKTLCHTSLGFFRGQNLQLRANVSLTWPRYAKLRDTAQDFHGHPHLATRPSKIARIRAELLSKAARIHGVMCFLANCCSALHEARTHSCIHHTNNFTHIQCSQLQHWSSGLDHQVQAARATSDRSALLAPRCCRLRRAGRQAVGTQTLMPSAARRKWTRLQKIEYTVMSL